MKKSAFNNNRAYEEGWGLFSMDDGRLAILTLDDPRAARPAKCECDNTHEQNKTCCRACWRLGFRSVAPDESPFKYDDEAVHYVMQRAAEGSRFHKKAIALAAKIRLP